jgi:hypothetical protein
MKLEQLIKIVDTAYPDGLVQQYYKDIDGKHGDGLAKFIVIELMETFDTKARTIDQLQKAEEVMRTATGELNCVTSAIYAEFYKKWEPKWRKRHARPRKTKNTR